MTFGGLKIFLQEIGALNFLGITLKTICIKMILTKKQKNTRVCYNYINTSQNNFISTSYFLISVNFSLPKA